VGFGLSKSYYISPPAQQGLKREVHQQVGIGLRAIAQKKGPLVEYRRGGLDMVQAIALRR